MTPKTKAVLIMGGMASAFLFLSGGMAWEPVKLLASGVRVEGEVEALPFVKGMYDAVYKYEYPPGVRRRSDAQLASAYPLHDQVGERVVMLVNPGNPDQARPLHFTELWAGPIVTGFIGLLCAAFPLLLAWRSWNRRRTCALLMRVGEAVEGRIVRAEVRRHIVLVDRNPWRFIVEATINGEKRTFMSRNVWFNIRPYLKRENVRVYVMPRDPGRYWVDLSWLPDSLERRVGMAGMERWASRSDQKK